LRDVTLEDKYAAADGPVLLSGTQALVRLLLMQGRRDSAAGLDTAGFVSGYRGSPLGTFDRELWRAQAQLQREGIRFQPAVNEDLAATAIWGSQQIGLFPGAKHEGVFALWYGKGPGVDRTGDAFRHANQAGTSPLGGVLVAFGDDHTAESSTLAHQSEHALAAAMIPVLNPSSVAELLELGLFGWALSRYSGLWVGLKCTGETVGSTATVDLDDLAMSHVVPTDVQPPGGGVHIRGGHAPLESESRLIQHKIPLAHAFARANGIDQTLIVGSRRRIGIVTTGKAYGDVRSALEMLGLDDERAAALGIGLYKVALSWPLEPRALRSFASGFDELLFVEEKRPLVEDQAARLLYDLSADVRPIIVGKTDEKGAALLPGHGALSGAVVAEALESRLARHGLHVGAPAHRAAREPLQRAVADRTPYFCSGCPHNRSTVVPEGSTAMAGIGCSYMAVWMDRSTLTSVHMGAEGANWIGIAPFSETQHVFQNIGDGTYFHSGTLAIRAAVAAGVNITYKILYNDAVAMTGGQPVDGALSVVKVAQQVLAEGVRAVAIVTDDPSKYSGLARTHELSVHHRSALDEVQRRLRDTTGATVLIYDQMCAAERRRRRKRAQHPEPAQRVFINAAVCEGCGDCSARSNCVSVLPLETALGRKRRIDQSACNKDFTCIEGFCPSFVTVEGAALRAPARDDRMLTAARELPLPTLGALDATCNILITGIGGTGVVTIAAILTMAAHVDGLHVTAYDMTGLAQKNGAVFSHIRLGRRGTALPNARIGAGEADVILGCDLNATSFAQVVKTIDADRSRLIVNSHVTPTGEFQRHGDLDLSADSIREALSRAAGDDRLTFVDAAAIASGALGDVAWANMIMLGFAFQAGLLPVSVAAVHRAIQINGAAVERNRLAFDLGRLAYHDPKSFRPVATPEATVPRTLDELIQHRATLLTQYQDAAYARLYTDFVAEVRAAEHATAPERDALTRAVATSLAKLMMYKDEYEVARLHVAPDFRRELREIFGDGFSIRYHLAPPLLPIRDRRGEPRKLVFGPWMSVVLRALARLKGLRGTPFDVFGYTAERRAERRLVDDYRASIRRLLAGLDSGRYELAVTIARLPEQIRGFGHVKRRSMEMARADESRLWSSFDRGYSDSARVRSLREAAGA
jgi:indolepyruvate ferredoxin oxidoreductase